MSILTIKQGGTGSDTTLNNDRVIVSSAETLVETTTTTTQVNLLDGFASVSTGTADNDKMVTKGYVDDHDVIGFPKNKIYYVNSAGSDTNDGKSDETPFATLAKAISEVNLQTPSITNQFEIRIIGGMSITADFIIPEYTVINAPSTRINCEVVGSNGSSLIFYGGATGKVGGLNYAFSKDSGGLPFYIRALNRIIASERLVGGNSAGSEIILDAPGIDCNSLILVSNNTGPIEINVDGDILNSGGLEPIIFLVSGGGDLFIRARKIIDTTSGAGLPSLYSNSGAKISLRVEEYLCPNRHLYELYNSTILDVVTNKWELTNTSNYADNTCKVNAIITSASASRNSHTFTNLSTFQRNIFTFDPASVYIITVTAPNNSSNTFFLSIDYNQVSGGYIFSDYNENDGAVIESPAGTFNITINGYGLASFNLVIGTLNGHATFAASTVTTGDTKLSIIKLSNN